MARTTVSTGTPWEMIAGYARAVRVRDMVFVAGTTASDENGDLRGGDDAYAQATYILAKIGSALRQAGADYKDVVRTRIYVADIDDWQAVGRAHAEVFAEIRPANTLVQVAGLVGGRRVEIEADAVVDGGGGG